ncbi:MAG: hypothetical protein D6694_10115 [Gammaproteobacteria bacterium]|nr:MAG: hypothetical protein D6694_10115 [Gammaproteobacteria bacterium]
MKGFLLDDHIDEIVWLVFNLLHVGAGYLFHPYADVWQARPEIRAVYLALPAFWSLFPFTVIEEYFVVVWGIAYTWLAVATSESGAQHPFALALAIHILITGILLALVFLVECLRHVLRTRWS